MTDGTSLELLETVAKRICVLECIRDGIDDRRTIADEINVSRQTVSRALEELERAKIIKDKYAEGFEITLFGRLAYQQFDELRTSYRWLLEAYEVLVHTPAEVPIDMRMINNGDTLASNARAPLQPFYEVREMMQSANELKCFFPVVLPCYMNFCHTQIIERGIEVEVILNDNLLPTLLSTYREEFRGCVQADNCTIWQTAEHLPLALGIIDDQTVWTGIHRSEGSHIGVVINSTDAAVDWAVELFECHREKANEVLLCEVDE